MAASALTPVVVSRDTTNGVDLTAALTAVNGVDGNTFPNDGRTLLRVKNGSGSPVTVTVPYTASIDGKIPAARTYSVAATTGDRLIGPFPPDLFSGNPIVTFSSATTVTAAAYQLDED